LWSVVRTYKEESYRKNCLFPVVKADIKRPRISIDVLEIVFVSNDNRQHCSYLQLYLVNAYSKRQNTYRIRPA
jgi:hypothetical protein